MLGTVRVRALCVSWPASSITYPFTLAQSSAAHLAQLHAHAQIRTACMANIVQCVCSRIAKPPRCGCASTQHQWPACTSRRLLTATAQAADPWA
eukprot:1357406-Pleurochrysis_carterae.AAC.1